MHLAFFLAMWIGCSEPTGSSANQPKAADTAAPTELDDTGHIEPIEVLGAAVTIESLEVRECTDPSPDAPAPFMPPSEAGDWDEQWIPWVDETAGRGWGLAVADFNGDGQLDVFLPNHGWDELYLGDGNGGFTASHDSIPLSGRDDTDLDTNGVAATDIDGDGDIDLYLANRGPDRLLINDGTGRFLDETMLSGIGSDSLDSISVSWGHLDDDGLPDLFVATYFMGIFPYEDLAAGRVPEGDANKLYRNLGGGRFEDISSTLPDAAKATFAFASGWHDINLDGRSDLIVVNDLGPIVVPNLVLLNEGGTLRDAASETSLDVSIYGMGLGKGDINRDGWPDFLFSSWDGLVFMESDGAGDWYENSINQGFAVDWTSRHVGWGTEFVDLNNDGFLDATVAFGAHIMGPLERAYFETGLGLLNPDEQQNMAFIGGPDGFVDSSDAWQLNDSAQSRIQLPVDINNDGWVDIVSRSLDRPATIQLASCGTNQWLVLAFEDAAPNTAGLGVTVELTANGVTTAETVTSGSTGIASSRPHSVRFGLGDQRTADITIHWLDGRTTTVSNIQSNQRLKITRS